MRAAFDKNDPPSLGDTSNCSIPGICDKASRSSSADAAISAMIWLLPAMNRCKLSGVSAARILPSYMISIRLHVISASGRMCVEISY